MNPMQGHQQRYRHTHVDSGVDGPIVIDVDVSPHIDIDVQMKPI